jgi:hypothetical protein
VVDEAMNEFVSQLRHHVQALCDHFGVNDLLEGRSEGKVPRRGSVSGVPFFFHGKGVRFELDDRLVDVDFCAEGFEVDWWRFQQFLAPITKRSSVAKWRDAYISALPGVNTRRTNIGQRTLVWNV